VKLIEILSSAFPSFCRTKGGGTQSVVSFFNEGFSFPKSTSLTGKLIVITDCTEKFLSVAQSE
jgi:hypothetical protein